MEIKKGDWFKCIKDVVMSDGDVEYINGEYYKSEFNGCITNKSGNHHHSWGNELTNNGKQYFQKLFTLQDLRDGKCAVYNDGELIQLKLILGSIFNDDVTSGTFKYYYKDYGEPWNCSDFTKLPTQSVYDFLPQIENNEEFPKVGVTDKPTRFSEFPVKPRPPYKDNVEPNHYGGKENPLEAIKIIQHYNLSFELGNVLKYIIRHDKKGASLQDLEKAKKYLEFEISKYN